MEDGLVRLDELTQEEVRMAVAQGLKATDEVDKKVQAVDDKVEAVESKVEGVDDRVQGVDNRVQGVCDKVQDVDHRVQGVDDRVRIVDDRVIDVGDKIDVLIDSAQFHFSYRDPHSSNLFFLGGDKIREDIQQVAEDMDDQKRESSQSLFPGDQSSLAFTGDQIRRDLTNWLSPPDPSVNYNTATDAHHEGTALWFTQSSAFNNWKASPSFLWIHGKRTSFYPTPLHLLISLPIYSWIWQECPQVRFSPTCFNQDY
jgi:hypothetical protein